jgi:hypothetical protein
MLKNVKILCMNFRFLVALVVGLQLPAHAEDYDVVVYGGTSGGVIAAVQAARSGRSVVLISPTEHLGGLTTSGLGWTDLGKASILGGLSLEFYQLLYTHYQADSAWNWQTRESFGNVGQGGPAFHAVTKTASVFEPKVAEAAFNKLLNDARVPVVRGLLDLQNGVELIGNRISAIALEDGRRFHGKMFIDASYEGDLLPGAKVSFTTGREANAEYGETFNGIQNGRALKNQLRSGIDPYKVPGEPASGLLTGVEPPDTTADGSADRRLQAYCYRMVLTDVAENRVKIERPEDYDETHYELVFRSIEAGQTSGFFKLDLMPNRKTDSNNTGGISTDFIGANYGDGWDWTTLSHMERAALARKHEDWQRGLVWTLQNHPRVPASIKEAYRPWGLPADEFVDNRNWPYQLYVREARRMISDVVMNERHCTGEVVVSDSIGLAAYAMDSHHTRRLVRDGEVKNEGDVQMPLANPYPVSYRSIVPKRGECVNLLVPWSLSSTHMAFGSIRMEPVFMILSQSAAVAADLAIQDEVAVQEVAYAKLRSQLVELGQSLGEPGHLQPTEVIDNSRTDRIVIDGEWNASSATPGFVGSDYLHDLNESKGTKQVTYQLSPAAVGTFRIFMRWTANPNRASNVPVAIHHAEGVTNTTVNQRENGAKWNIVGIYKFDGNAGQSVVVSNSGSDGFVIADAIGLSPVLPGEDTDGDGLCDLDEMLLGTDPLWSDRLLVEGIRRHPDVFGLHSIDEIFRVRIGGQELIPLNQERFTLDLGMEVFGPNGWHGTDRIRMALPSHRSEAFFRVALP